MVRLVAADQFWITSPAGVYALAPGPGLRDTECLGAITIGRSGVACTGGPRLAAEQRYLTLLTRRRGARQVGQRTGVGELAAR